MIIAFEGVEGSGKGTQTGLLEQALVSRGYNVLCIIEPGGTPTGQAIRDVLLNRTELIILGITEAFLFSASRAQQVRTVVRPALREGKIVISDRSFYSTYAYQGYAREGDLDVISQLTEIAVGKTKPDIVILLDLPPEVGLARKLKQNKINRLDAEELPFHRRVRNGYLALAEKHSQFWVVVDATLSVEEAHNSILQYVLGKLN